MISTFCMLQWLNIVEHLKEKTNIILLVQRLENVDNVKIILSRGVA